MKLFKGAVSIDFYSIFSLNFVAAICSLFSLLFVIGAYFVGNSLGTFINNPELGSQAGTILMVVLPLLLIPVHLYIIDIVLMLGSKK